MRREGPTALPLQANIVAHFDAATVNISNGATVTTWTDSVNSIAAATQVGTRPIYQTSSVNGLPSVKFAGGGLKIATPGALKTAIDSQEFSILIVFKVFGSGTSFGNLIGANAGAANVFYYADGTNAGNIGAASWDVPFTGQTSFSTLGSTSTASATYSSSGYLQSFYINGGAYTSSTGAAQGTGGNDIVLGTNAANNFPVNAEIFDIVVWDVMLTPPQYVQAEKWARDKFAQTYPWSSVSAINTFFGDSITQGVGASTVANQAPYLAAQSLGLSYGQWHNLGIGGITIANMDTLAATWVDPLPATYSKRSNLIGFEWFNSNAAGGNPPPGPYNSAVTYLANRHALTNQKVVWGTSTAFSGDPSSNRNSYNSAIAGTIPNSNIDSYMALHTNAQIGSTTAYANHVGNWSDGVHLSDAGYVFLATEFVNGINGVP